MNSVKATSPFADNAEDNKNSDDQSHETAVATATEDSALANPVPSNTFAVSASDLRLPVLRIAAKIGSLCDDFGPESIVVDGDLKISDGKTPIELTVLNARKEYVENIPFGSDKTPKVFYSEEEVLALGGTFERTFENGQEVEPNSHWKTLVLYCLVKNPLEEESSHFPFQFGDDSYGIFQYTLMKSAYTRAAHKFITAYSLPFQQDWLTGSFHLTAFTAEFNTPSGTRKVVVPEVRYGPKHGDEFKEWARTLIPAA
ncbi:MAG: hypothetical protein VXB01_04105 [Opitutae bacterium]